MIMRHLNIFWRFAVFIVLAIDLCGGLSNVAAKVSSKSVLVIGGTGRVGRAIVPKLVVEGFSVRVLCRDIEKAKTFAELDGAELVLGDVGNMESLVTATAGCSTVVDVHGVKPVRFSKITDLFTHPRDIPGHPYQINYLGVRRILVAMEINKCQKIVRITGALVGKSAFSPFRVLFNSLLSFSSKWHEASEIAIRNSGMDYTVIRPTEIVNEPSLIGSKNSSLNLLAIDAPVKGSAILSRIPIQDLADLLVLSVRTNHTGASMLSRSSAICGTKKVQGPTTWTDLVETIPKDRNNLKIKNHKIAVGLYGTVFLSVLTVASRSLFMFIRNIVRIVLTYYTKNLTLFSGQ